GISVIADIAVIGEQRLLSARSIPRATIRSYESGFVEPGSLIFDDGDIGDQARSRRFQRSSPSASWRNDCRTDSVSPPTPMRKRSGHSKNRPGTTVVSKSLRNKSHKASALPDFKLGNTIVPYSGQK